MQIQRSSSASFSIIRSSTNRKKKRERCGYTRSFIIITKERFVLYSLFIIIAFLHELRNRRVLSLELCYSFVFAISRIGVEIRRKFNLNRPTVLNDCIRGVKINGDLKL